MNIPNNSRQKSPPQRACEPRPYIDWLVSPYIGWLVSPYIDWLVRCFRAKNGTHQTFKHGVQVPGRAAYECRPYSGS